MTDTDRKVEPERKVHIDTTVKGVTEIDEDTTIISDCTRTGDNGEVTD